MGVPGCEPGAAGPEAEPSGRGVEFLDSRRTSEEDISPVRGVSMLDRPLRGVDLLIVGLRTRPMAAGGITISVSRLFSRDPSIESRTPLVLLSLRLSRSVFSPLTAPVRANPLLELLPEAAESGFSLELVALEILSTREVRTGDGSRPRLSSVSTQSAGVGGTGPNADTPLGGGRRVGGDMIGSLPLFGLDTLCDLEPGGGGPGGGGGRGMPGSHRTCEADLDLAEVGVAIAPVEAALREAGATFCGSSESDGLGGGI